jgi:exonuclease SbcD
MSINLVWRTDVHLADKGPSSRKDDWTDTVFDKLDQVRRVAAKVNAAAILDGGDFFNIKSPSRNSHALVHRTAEHHANYPCPVYCTPGNHDAVYGDYSFLPQQPLGVLFSTGVFKRLYDEHEAVFTQDGVKVRVVGIPYHGTTYDMERFTSIEKGDEDILICVAHVLASRKGGTMFEGEDIVKYKDLVDTAPDVFLFGHWHKDQGVEQIGDKTFVNIGSLTRGALSQDEVQRRPACAILTCNPATKDAPASVTTTVVRLRVKDAAEVFDVEARERQIQRQVEMDSFVNSIRDTLTRSDTTGDLSTLITDMDLSGDIRERALSYLERA